MNKSEEEQADCFEETVLTPFEDWFEKGERSQVLNGLRRRYHVPGIEQGDKDRGYVSVKYDVDPLPPQVTEDANFSDTMFQRGEMDLFGETFETISTGTPVFTGKIRVTLPDELTDKYDAPIPEKVEFDKNAVRKIVREDYATDHTVGYCKRDMDGYEIGKISALEWNEKMVAETAMNTYDAIRVAHRYIVE